MLTIIYTYSENGEGIDPQTLDMIGFFAIALTIFFAYSCLFTRKK